MTDLSCERSYFWEHGRAVLEKSEVDLQRPADKIRFGIGAARSCSHVHETLVLFNRQADAERISFLHLSGTSVSKICMLEGSARALRESHSRRCVATAKSLWTV